MSGRVDCYYFCAHCLNLLPILGKYEMNGGKAPPPNRVISRGAHCPPKPFSRKGTVTGLASQMPHQGFLHIDRIMHRGKHGLIFLGECGRIESPVFLGVMAAAMRSSLL